MDGRALQNYYAYKGLVYPRELIARAFFLSFNDLETF